MHDDQNKSRHQPTEDLTKSRQGGDSARTQPAQLPDSIGKYKILPRG